MNGDARRLLGGAPAAISLPAVTTAIALLLPVSYLLIRATSGGWAAAAVLTHPGTFHLLVRTVVLAVAVTAATVAIGVPVALVTTRTDLPLRRLFAVLTALPLVIPSFVGAYAYIAAFGPGGLAEGWLAPLGIRRLPDVYGFSGAFVTLTAFTYPYVLLTVQAALRTLDPALEEASRSLGQHPRATFFRVTLPQLRPAIGAGGLLVALYVLSDFGAVSLMRYSTFTRAIYLQYQAAFDRTPAAVLGLVLVACTLIVLLAEARVAISAQQARSSVHGTVARPPPLLHLGAWRWPAAAGCTLLVVAGLGVPLATIAVWGGRGLRTGQALGLAAEAAWHSLESSVLGAVAAVVAALPVGIVSARYHSRTSRLLERVAYAGHALPGIVVALSLVFFGARYAGALYQSLAMLVFAYGVLFLPQALGAVRASLLQISPSVEEAARSLGSSPLAAIRRIILPMARRGALAGGALVFLTCMKELPATLLLAPTGFRTLATDVWDAASEAFFARAAIPALALVVLGSLPLAVLVVRQRELTR